MELELPAEDAGGVRIPLSATTWDLDRSEGDYINHLKSTNVDPPSDPLVDVPDDFKRNIACTSGDALRAGPYGRVA